MKFMKKIYIGNLSFNTTEEKIREAFSKFGEVLSVTIIKDQFTEISKGFGFVEMEDDSNAENAILSLNGKELDKRKVRVSEAVEKSEQTTQNRRKFFEKKSNKASGFKKPVLSKDNEF